ncbi:MAG: hypothetical protein ACTS6J_14355, partial [Burkholderiales bacterium]
SPNDQITPVHPLKNHEKNQRQKHAVAPDASAWKDVLRCFHAAAQNRWFARPCIIQSASIAV